jgi:hypothetical protein
VSPRTILLASPLRLVVMLACAALGALVADVEWLRATTTAATTAAATSASASACATADRRSSSSNNITTTNAATAAMSAPTSSSLPIRIRYAHVHGRPYQQRYGLRYACDPTQKGIQPLPHELQGPGMVDFHTDITTSLKVAVVGDSIGVQIGHRLEEAMQPTAEENAPYSRLAYVETNWNNLVASYPMRGGGALLSYRINGLFWENMQTSRRRLRQPPQRRHRKLQSYFRPQKFNRSEIDVALRQPMIPLGNVDVMVQRITFPWIPLARITFQTLEKNTVLASELFGMGTLVYVNLYFTNNVVDANAYQLFLQKTEVVRNFVRTYVPPATSPLKRVLLLDLDRLVDLLNERNAQSIGIDTASEPFEHWMLSQTLGPYDPKAVFRKHIGQVCGAMVPDHTASCDRNMIFVDGLHFCPSTFAGRITGGIACLIECAELDRVNNHHQHHDEEDEVTVDRGPDSFLRQCERKCNDKYMSLEPIPVSDMVQWNGTHER